MMNRITGPFLNYVNAKTPYPNLVQKSSFYQRPIISQITMLICAVLTACHIVDRFSWRSRQISHIRQDHDMTPLAGRRLHTGARLDSVSMTEQDAESSALLSSQSNIVPQLDTSSITEVDRFNFEETIPAFMAQYTCVCPYKPCGYTEFTWESLAQGPAEKDVGLGRKYRGKIITDAAQRKAIQAQRNQEVKPQVDAYFQANQFGNCVKKVERQRKPEFRACHIETIFQICQLNQDKIQVGSSKAEEVTPLIINLKRALSEKNEAEVARIFLQLTEIPNSLPVGLFQLAFGDVDGTFFTGYQLPQSLKDMKTLYDEFVNKGHNEQTVRNIVGYYYHNGSSNPIAQARKTLAAFPKIEVGSECVVIDDQIKKSGHLNI